MPKPKSCNWTRNQDSIRSRITGGRRGNLASSFEVPIFLAIHTRNSCGLSQGKRQRAAMAGEDDSSMSPMMIGIVIVLIVAAGWWLYSQNSGPCIRCQQDPSGWVYVQSKLPSGDWGGGPKWQQGMYCLKSDGSSRVPYGGGACMSGSSLADCASKIQNIKTCPPATAS